MNVPNQTDDLRRHSPGSVRARNSSPRHAVVSGVVVDLDDRHSRNRADEWKLSILFVLLSLWTIIWPGSFANGRFAAIDNIISPPELTLFLGCLGFFRMSALYSNGHYPILGPIVRALCSLGGAFIFVMMAFALWINHKTTGNDASPGIVVYLVLTWVEIASGVRAAGDAKFRA